MAPPGRPMRWGFDGQTGPLANAFHSGIFVEDGYADVMVLGSRGQTE